MKKGSALVDAYIAKSPEFARPILRKLRELVHEACPQIEETMKWGFPHFEYKGIVASMAAFKNYASFGFWKGSLMRDPHHLFEAVGKTSMNALTVAEVSGLPNDKILIEYIHEAVALNEQGVKVPAPKKREARQELEIPDYFLAALKKNKKALATFEAFSYSHRKEYVEWIVEAKQESTRNQRLATAISWMAEGKSRNWKYRKC
jgi:uncharacterized protein YdeI (YjbR/CyaY-like superfamily)